MLRQPVPLISVGLRYKPLSVFPNAPLMWRLSSARSRTAAVIGSAVKRAAAGVRIAKTTLMVLSLLASPFVWMHHLVILWPGLVFVARDAWRCLEKQEKPVSGIVRLALVLAVAWPYPHLSKTLGFPTSLANVMSATNLLLVLTLYGLVLSSRSETRLKTMEAPRVP